MIVVHYSLGMILFLTVIVVIVSTILIYVKFWWSNREYFELAEKFQGPPGFPFIGNLNLFMKHSTKGEIFFRTRQEGQLLTSLQKISDIIKIVRYICTPFDSPVRIWIGPYLFLNIKKPIDIQRVLQSTACTDKLYIYRFLTQQPSVMAAECKKYNLQIVVSFFLYQIEILLQMIFNSIRFPLLQTRYREYTGSYSIRILIQTSCGHTQKVSKQMPTYWLNGYKKKPWLALHLMYEDMSPRVLWMLFVVRWLCKVTFSRCALVF